MAKAHKIAPVKSHVDFPQLEGEILAYWQKEKVFEKSLQIRKTARKFTFYDGPPFATGLPHYGHILAMAIKDAVTRLKTMQGFYVPRRLGWDTHGLPVEYELEKEWGISGKKHIEEKGVEEFNEGCRSIVFRYARQWEKTIDRMGRWVDKKNTYATLNTDYMESIWWVFKDLWQKDLIYRGFRSMPYCPRCATPLSNFETNLGYKDDIEDPSVYVKFQSEEDPKTFFLAWTTTPWTLPGNAALAINPKIDYVKVKVGEDFLILAQKRLETLDAYEKISDIKPESLLGKKYKPLFDFFIKNKDKKENIPYLIDQKDREKEAYKIVYADFVSTEDGTGIVHIAPAFGEDDLELGKKEDLPLLQTVNKNGEMIIEPYIGTFVKKADPEITEHLDQQGSLYKAETIKHTYPFCWRCETPLIYYATPNWFVKVSTFRKKLVENNKKIKWTPKHLKEGRFGNWLSEARDWSISRNRFWGTPLPVWQCTKCGQYEIIGSVMELKEKSTNFEKLEKSTAFLFKAGKQKSSSLPVDLHRPYIDEIKMKCSKCQGEASRIEEVLDCWFESGSMPYAQDHFPFQNQKEWEDNFPADFIAEGLDQTRGWFYTLHVLATAIKDKPAFKNIIVNGIVVAKDGKKLSKRLRNYPEPDEIFNKYGADAMRYYLLSSPAAVAQDVRFSAEIVEETVRKFFLILWNSYSFFVTYYNLDNSSFNTKTVKPVHILDKWILSRLNTLINKVQQGSDDYDLLKMTRPLQDFVTELSTWYIRRSRDRLGPSVEDSKDKESFYQTMHIVLTTFCRLLAPFAPFTADAIYRNLTGEKSVHLSNWPKVSTGLIDTALEKRMQQAQELASVAHAHRKLSGVKVRIPFKKLSYKGPEKIQQEILKIILEEINVKELVYAGKNTTSGFKILGETGQDNQDLIMGKAREIIRQIQVARKEADCNLTEKVIVFLPDWPKSKEEYIKKQTLASKLIKGDELKINRI